MLGNSAGYTLIPLFRSWRSAWRTIPYSSRPGSSSNSVSLPEGSDKGESIDTRNGFAESVLSISSASAATSSVASSSPMTAAHPDLRFSLPVRSIPTIGLLSNCIARLRKSEKNQSRSNATTVGTDPYRIRVRLAQVIGEVHARSLE